jgi:hypothetical protein
MKEQYGEGLASHTGSESCTRSCKAEAQAVIETPISECLSDCPAASNCADAFFVRDSGLAGLLYEYSSDQIRQEPVLDVFRFFEEDKKGRRARVTPLGSFVDAINLRFMRCTSSVQSRSSDDPNCR